VEPALPALRSGSISPAAFSDRTTMDISVAMMTMLKKRGGDRYLFSIHEIN